MAASEGEQAGLEAGSDASYGSSGGEAGLGCSHGTGGGEIGLGWSFLRATRPRQPAAMAVAARSLSSFVQLCDSKCLQLRAIALAAQ